MQQKSNSVWGMAGAYIAFVIGSGFASGQEIVQFYAVFGRGGLGAIAISAVLLSWVGGSLMAAGCQMRQCLPTRPYRLFCGKPLGIVFEWLTSIYLFCTLVVMYSGAGVALQEYYALPHLWGSLFMAVLVFVTYAGGFRRLTDIVGRIGPIIIAFTLAVAVGTLWRTGIHIAENIQAAKAAPNWWSSGILYAAYNVFGAIPFLMALGSGAASRKKAAAGGIVGGLSLMGTVLCMDLALLSGGDMHYTVPTLQLAHELAGWMGVLYSLILLCGIYSTAAPMLWTVCGNMARQGDGKWPAALLSAAALALAQLPFDRLVALIYPCTGYMGLLLLVCLAVWQLRKNKERQP